MVDNLWDDITSCKFSKNLVVIIYIFDENTASQTIMQILTKIEDKELPFEWLYLTDLRKSNSLRKEIYLGDKGNPVEELKAFFYSCFGNLKDNLIVWNGKWAYFFLDTWEIDSDNYNLSIENSSKETARYLKTLADSDIDTDYEGLCICNDWEELLSIIIPAVVNHSTPYSPYFLDKKNEIMFYFHHTNSIGIYYKSENEIIQQIFQKASALNCVISD